MLLDTSTLFVVLIVSHLLMACALWIAFAPDFRAGSGKWTGALISHGLAWLLLTASQADGSPASFVIAGTLFAYGCSLQISAVLEFRNRITPVWLLFGSPIAAFLVLTAWFSNEAILSMSGRSDASGIWLLLIYAMTAALSFAFLLMHKVRARELATTDPLTGVYNRRMFEELAEGELSRARRAGTALSLLMLDLDRFKRVNDTYGHRAGDEVLSMFAALVRKCLRKEDLLARHGGEEFVALLPGLKRSAASALAERIRRELAHTTLRVAGHDVRITVSVGVVSESGDQLPSLQAFLGNADKALYEAKNEGRNRIAIFSERLPIAA